MQENPSKPKLNPTSGLKLREATPPGLVHLVAYFREHFFLEHLNGTEIWCTWAPVISFLKKIKNYIFEFQKIMERNSHIVNDVSHKHAKNQFQILNILSYTKMTKL
jgi:hypothetical protein